MGLILTFVGALCWPAARAVEARLFKNHVHMTALQEARDRVVFEEVELATYPPLEKLRAARARAELALIAYREAALQELAGCTDTDCRGGCTLASQCAAYMATITTEEAVRERLRVEERLVHARECFVIARQNASGRSRV